MGCNWEWHQLSNKEYLERHGGYYPRSCPNCHELWREEKKVIIESVTLHFPNSECGEIVDFTVGKPWHPGGKPVIKIEKAERCGEMAMIPYYKIYTEDGIVSEMHQYGQVNYKGE